MTSMHKTDPNHLRKAKQQGIHNRLTPILLNLAVQHGIPTPLIAQTFKLNPRTLHNHLNQYAASTLRLREELTLLSITTCKAEGRDSRYEGLVPLRLQGIRPRLIAEHYNVSESMLRTYYTKHGIETQLKNHQQQKALQALHHAVEQGLLPPGLLPAVASTGEKPAWQESNPHKHAQYALNMQPKQPKASKTPRKHHTHQHKNQPNNNTKN